MIRDLFHSPPIYKANITLSFKPRDKTNMQAKVGDKRKPITFSGKSKSSGAGGKKGRGERQLYIYTVEQKSPFPNIFLHYLTFSLHYLYISFVKAIE